MRVIKLKTLRFFWQRHPETEPALLRIYRVLAQTPFHDWAEMRRTFPDADAVKARSGRTVTVFNVGKTGYRLLAAIHYNRQMCFILKVMPHKEYERGDWRDLL